MGRPENFQAATFSSMLLLSQSARRGTVAVLFLDLDHFKFINDSRGHRAGDELLHKIAVRLSTVMRPGGTLARFGGDKFCIVCDGLGDGDQVTAIARRLLDTLKVPFSLSSGAHFVLASIGISLSDTGRPPREIAAAKAAGGDTQRTGHGLGAETHTRWLS